MPEAAEAASPGEAIHAILAKDCFLRPTACILTQRRQDAKKYMETFAPWRLCVRPFLSPNDLLLSGLSGKIFLMNPLKQVRKKNISLLCLTLAAIVFCAHAALAKDVAVIRIKHRWASELAPIVQNLLSPGGSVTVADRVNSLVIVADPDSIQRVRGYLAEFDKPLEQVRIKVRFYERRTGDSGAASVRARVSGDDWHASVGGRREDGADISADQASRRRTNFSEHTVIATSGQAAYIVAGR